MQSVKRIGLLGGSFDPIHKGHLQLAKAILKEGCDEVWLLPCVVSPLKENKLSNFDLRVKMIQAAIRPFKKMKVCTIEKQLPLPSYTYNTLQVLKKKMPQIQFIFYIGNDQAKQLDQWYRIEDCLKLCEFRIFRRDEAEIQCPYHLKTVNLPLIPISSTQVRKGRIQDVPKSVAHIIWEEGLYLEELPAASMSEKRYLHSLSVAQTSKEIASAHHLDEKKAYRAGLLHDLCKQMPQEAMEAWMKLREPMHLHEPKAIWHGYIVDHMLKRKFVIRDKDLLCAVHHHVAGESKNAYAMIVFIADKCNPLRNYDISRQLSLAKSNLKKAREVVSEEQKNYLKERN